MSRLRKSVIFAVILSLIIIASSLSPAGRSLLITANILIPNGNWRPLQLITRSPIKQDYTIPSTTGDELKVRIYQPRQFLASASQTGLVIYTPLIGGGLDDPRLVNLAETFARAGFYVATPAPPTEKRLISLSDTKDVSVTANHLLQESGASRLGMFGISYGTGPLMASAAELAKDLPIDFIISLNGFYDLNNVVDFIKTGKYGFKDIVSNRQPHPYTKEVLDASLNGSDLATFLKSREYTQLQQKLSPSNIIDRLDNEFFIIHSTDDDFIPYTESLRLYDDLSGRVPATLVLTDVVQHGTYRPISFTNLQRYYFPAARDFNKIIHRLLTTYQ